MNLQSVIDAKLSEMSSFVLATARDVVSADVGELERGVLSVQLLRLLVSVSPATFPAAPAPKPQPVVTVVEPEVALVPETPTVQAVVPAPEAKAQGKRGPQFTDEMIAGAVSRTNTVDEAAELLGCSSNTVARYRKRNGLTANYVSIGPKPDGVRWDDEALKKLREMAIREPRPTNKALADAFGTTPSAIQTALSRHGITRQNGGPIASMRPRDCMTCQRPFLSEGNHNRMCPRCLTDDHAEVA
jgi:hypothetical protein